MTSRIKQVGDGIVALLNQGESAGEFTFDLQTTFHFDFPAKLSDEDGRVHVDVIWAPGEFRMLSRTQFNDYLRFRIILYRKFTTTDFSDGQIDNLAIDPYVQQLEQINDWLANPDYHRLPVCTNACWIAPGTKIGEGVHTQDLGISVPCDFGRLTQQSLYIGELYVLYRWALTHTA